MSVKETNKKEENKEELEKATFISIIMRMATGAYISLGLAVDPTTGKKNKDLEVSKYLIDSLRTLREKTKGNLDKEEEGYLNNIIQDLELKYVKEKEPK
ncbi:DUF1844 domain-containing protein [candidate division WOR-3 bacterium]|nr:DUF1844 domain-containing protein [candidate division WOR-3 bacterium]